MSLNFLCDEGQTLEQFVAEISPVIFDPAVLAKRTVQSGDRDLILASANNYYGGGITQKEVEEYYAAMKAGKDTITPISYGLNSRLVKENGKIVEKVWKVGGLYSAAIEQIVGELQKAVPFAENDTQKAIIEKLIEYYQTGDLKNIRCLLHPLGRGYDFGGGFRERFYRNLRRSAGYESQLGVNRKLYQ